MKTLFGLVIGFAITFLFISYLLKNTSFFEDNGFKALPGKLGLTNQQNWAGDFPQETQWCMNRHNRIASKAAELFFSDQPVPEAPK